MTMVKLLKKAAKQIIDVHREEHGFMTKVLLKKAAKKDFGIK